MALSVKEKEQIAAQADKLVKKGKIQEAVAEYEKLVADDEQDVKIRAILGDLYIELNQKEKAIEEFKNVAANYEKKGIYSKSIALYKRIQRINPRDLEAREKLANLYRNQGFLSEAKVEYESLAKEFIKNKEHKNAIRIFQVLLDLEPSEIEYHLKLAELYQQEKIEEPAINELNEVAEIFLRREELNKAREFIEEAKKINEENPRTLSNLLEILKKENKREEALKFIETILQKDKENLKALNYLADIRFEEGQYKEAEDLYLKIISARPKEVDARVKLGKIYIREGKLDQAFHLYEPLVDGLMGKQKLNKAVGVLGLILTSKQTHIPTLEKLAEVYKNSKQLENLEKVLSLLLDEYEKAALQEKQLSVLEELIETFPERDDFRTKYNKLIKEMGLEEKVESNRGLIIEKEKKKNIVDAHLVKAELYAEQGLFKNARRILEDLRLRFPEEEIIDQKIEELKSTMAEMDNGEMIRRVEKASEKETVLFGHPTSSQTKERESIDEDIVEERITAADIFAETDIIPIITKESGPKEFYELDAAIRDELEAIKTVYNYQLRGDTAIVEKALSDIVSEFKKALSKKVDKEDYESRYNLGIAFMEQGLYEEAIEEFNLAAQEESLFMDASIALAMCYKEKKDFDKAMQWLEKAEKIVEENTFPYYALKYEEALLLETTGDKKKAEKMYEEVRNWNEDYRDVRKKLEELKSN